MPWHVAFPDVDIIAPGVRNVLAKTLNEKDRILQLAFLLKINITIDIVTV